MSQLIVLSAIGTDRAGIIKDLTKVVLDCGGNIEESRMTALGTEFAMLLLISGNWHALGKLEGELEKLQAKTGLITTIRATKPRTGLQELVPYGVDVISLDHEGIVFNLANFFSSRNIEVADLTTRRYAAAHTGAPMFSVQMTVNVPGKVHISQLREEFMELCDHLNLDAIIEPVKS
jgi:glycine cleavage system transcriptional repressor